MMVSRYVSLVMTGLALATLAMQVPSVSAASVDEEEIIERDVLFSVPADLVDRQRTSAKQSGHAWLFGLSLLSGHDDNTHHSPDILARGSSTVGDWLYLRSDKRFGQRTRLLNTANWKQTNYNAESTADFRRGSLSNWLEVELGPRWRVTADFDVVGENDDATLITGAPYTRDYGYWRYAGELLATWRIGGPHQVRFGGEWVGKNYGEVVGFPSWDWNQLLGIVRYRYRIAARHYLKLGYSIGKRDYDENPATTLGSGLEEPGNPAESHRYQKAEIGYEVPVTTWLDASADFSYQNKTDLFQGYENWSQREIHAWLGIKPPGRFNVTTDLRVVFHKYAHLLADNGDEVKYTRISMQTGARLRVTELIRLSAAVQYAMRSSNMESGLYYRDYEGLIVTGGIGLFLLP